MIKVVAIGRCGASLRVVISLAMAKQLGWKRGDFVSVSDTESGSVVLSKVPREFVLKSTPRHRARINELFAYAKRDGSTNGTG